MEDDQLDWGVEDDWLPIISSDCRITTDCAEKEVEAAVAHSSRPISTRDAVVNIANGLVPHSGGRCAASEWMARDYMGIQAIPEQHLQTPSLTENAIQTIDQQLKEEHLAVDDQPIPFRGPHLLVLDEVAHSAFVHTSHETGTSGSLLEVLAACCASRRVYPNLRSIHRDPGSENFDYVLRFDNAMEAIMGYEVLHESTINLQWAFISEESAMRVTTVAEDFWVATAEDNLESLARATCALNHGVENISPPELVNHGKRSAVVACDELPTPRRHASVRSALDRSQRRTKIRGGLRLAITDRFNMDFWDIINSIPIGQLAQTCSPAELAYIYKKVTDKIPSVPAPK